MAQPEIYLIRHGETEWNCSGHYQGQLDSRLTNNGEQQARAVGRLVRQLYRSRGEMPFYCSPLGRCRQTADLLCKTGGISMENIIYDPLIQELNCGHWQTWTRNEVRERWPKEVALYEADKWNYKIPGGGENGPMLLTRADSWLKSLSSKGPVLVVSHGMIGRFIRGICRDLTPDEILSLEVPQGVIYHLHKSREIILDGIY